MSLNNRHRNWKITWFIQKVREKSSFSFAGARINFPLDALELDDQQEIQWLQFCLILTYNVCLGPVGKFNDLKCHNRKKNTMTSEKEMIIMWTSLFHKPVCWEEADKISKVSFVSASLGHKVQPPVCENRLDTRTQLQQQLIKPLVVNIS